MKKVSEDARKSRERLRALRESLQMTQREFAKEFYVSAGAIAHWESGKREIPGPAKRLIELYEKILISKKASNAGR